MYASESYGVCGSGVSAKIAVAWASVQTAHVPNGTYQPPGLTGG